MVVADKLTEYPKSLSPRHSFLLKHFLSFFFMYQKWEKEERLQISVWGGGPNDPHFTLLITIVPERFRNKLNYFSFCLISEKLFVTCDAFFIQFKICKTLTVRFEPQTLKFKSWRLRQSIHTRPHPLSQIVIHYYYLNILPAKKRFTWFF